MCEVALLERSSGVKCNRRRELGCCCSRGCLGRSLVMNIVFPSLQSRQLM